MQYLIHPLIQPQLEGFSLRLHGSLHVVMHLLATRCGRSLKRLKVIPHKICVFFS